MVIQSCHGDLADGHALRRARFIARALSVEVQRRSNPKVSRHGFEVIVKTYVLVCMIYILMMFTTKTRSAIKVLLLIPI